MQKYLNIIFLVILLLAVFLARQPFAQRIWPNIYENVIRPTFEKIVSFFQKHIISRITRETEKRAEIAKEKLEEETEKIGQTILEKIRIFFLTQFKKLFPQN